MSSARRALGIAVAVTALTINERIDQMLLAGGAVMRVNDAGRDHGQIRAFQNRTYDPSKVVPTVILRSEDYGRISRILADGTPVELEFTIVNQLYPEGKTSYNAIAEIPGTERKDEPEFFTWHTNLDTYERIVEEDVKRSAIAIAGAVYHVAMRDEMLPRFSKEDMPEPQRTTP